MPIKASDDDPEKARRFREAALPYLDDVYTLARYLLRNADRRRGRGAGMLSARAEAFRQLSRAGDEAVAVRDPAQRLPRRICPARAPRRPARSRTCPRAPSRPPLWHEAEETPEAQILRRWDADTIRRLVAALAEPFRETFVLREIHNLSYREIAEVAEVPVGTVMSRLARARAMLRSAWMAEEEQPK